MSLRAIPLAVAVALITSGCATYIDVQRKQPAIYQVQEHTPSIGLLNVDASEDVMARAPNDFSNMTGLITKVSQEHLASAKPELKFVDYTGLGLKPQWIESKPQQGALPYVLPPLDMTQNAAIQTSLLTAVKVVGWRLEEQPATKERSAAKVATVSLVFATFSRDGKFIENQFVTAVARENSFGVTLTTVPEHPMMVTWFRASDGKKSNSLFAADRSKLFWAALTEAVSYHYYPFSEHAVDERFVLIDDEPYKAGIEDAKVGKYDDALAKWTAIYEQDPKAHGALYNAGLMHLIRGEEEKAQELFSRAIASKDMFMYQQTRNTVRYRLEQRRKVGADTATATPAGGL